jgi:hypothetical protein
LPGLVACPPEAAVGELEDQGEGGEGRLHRRASPLNQPAATVFPIAVCGNHFPVNPLTRK